MTTKKYLLDRSSFKASTFNEADDQYSYWKNKSLKERLEAAYYLIITAYNYSSEVPPTLDRKHFATRKFKD